MSVKPPPLLEIFYVGKSYLAHSSSPLKHEFEDDVSNSCTSETSKKKNALSYLEELARMNAAEAATSDV